MREGWSALRRTTWLRGQGFPGTSPGNHISARAQEFIIGEASCADARVVLLQGVYVQLAIHMGHELVVPQPHPIPHEPVVSGAARPVSGGQSLPHTSSRVEELPTFLAWSFARPSGIAERFRSKLMGDEEGQVRMYGICGRCELVHKADRFAGGKWAAVIREATQYQAVHTPRCERSEEVDQKHRGKAAQERVQRG